MIKNKFKLKIDLIYFEISSLKMLSMNDNMEYLNIASLSSKRQWSLDVKRNNINFNNNICYDARALLSNKISYKSRRSTKKYINNNLGLTNKVDASMEKQVIFKSLLNTNQIIKTERLKKITSTFKNTLQNRKENNKSLDIKYIVNKAKDASETNSKVQNEAINNENSKLPHNADFTWRTNIFEESINKNHKLLSKMSKNGNSVFKKLLSNTNNLTKNISTKALNTDKENKINQQLNRKLKSSMNHTSKTNFLCHQINNNTMDRDAIDNSRKKQNILSKFRDKLIKSGIQKEWNNFKKTHNNIMDDHFFTNFLQQRSKDQ